MLKRILSCILVVTLTLTALPMTAFAKTNNILYGDVNVDGEVGLNDVLMLKRYIAEENPSGFSFVNADVNMDNEADMTDLLMLKKYLAEWEIHLGPELLTVSFYDGDRLIDTLTADKGSPLGEVPAVAKSSKANAILEGYYIDKEFSEPFYAENPVQNSMNVYAKYTELGSTEELNLTSFAQMNQASDLSFEIKQVSGNILPADAATLIVKDGSDPVSLSVTDEDEDGVYIVKAPAGFNEGCSYELTLADGWYFKDKDETIRTASFSIAMAEVENLEMNDEITYIKDSDSISYNVGGASYEVLTSDILSENGGTFDYTEASILHTEDILCIYVGINPTERDPKKGSELLDPAVYVKVSGVNGTTVSFAPLNADDQTKLYNVPDNFPINVPALPAIDTGCVNLNALDRDLYATMMGADGTYENAVNKIAVGDFVTLFVSQDNIQSEDSLYYGQITDYNKNTGEITYKQVTRQTILDSMDLYSDLDIAGSDLITEEEKETIENVLLAQIEESNFAMEAATILSDMVTKTDGFRNNMTVQEYLLTDENGNPLSEDQIKLLNLGGSFELTDKIKLSVELITKGDQLHFDGGVQLAIKVDAKFEVELEDDAKIAIDLTATFVEEVQIDPSVRGKIVTKEILWIPIPIGVSVNATVDIRNFTAFSFAAEIYTVAAEDKSIWDKIKNITNDPTEVLGLPGIPDDLKDGLKTVGDVMDKIEEIKGKIDKATDTIDTINGYKEDMEALWGVVEETGLTTKEDWEQMGEKLGKTSVAADLLNLMNMTTETEISTEYLEDMQALMDKYSEMVQKETDWVELVNKEMFFAEVNILGIVIGVSADFIVRADMSIAIGSNLEYEVGKRYNFWFKIGLFKPSAGSSTMDLLDEHFAFQFYVMGRIGLKAGVRAKVYVGIGSGKFASVGIAAELGPYIKIYGFFVYEYTKFRPAGTQNWTSKERMAGALYIDFGLYFKMGFEANALGDLFEYTYDFLDVEIPLLTAGESRYFYSNAYEAEADETLIIKDEDDNSTTGITMKLPDATLALSYMDLNTGVQGSQSLDYSKYIFTLSNPNFKIDQQTGEISVTVPDNTRYMECDLTITYRYGKMAFSQYDMSVTVPLVWTNLSTDELSEYYTASVRVGNDTDGYQTVWHKRVLKNQEYDLPTEEEIREMIGWNDAKHTASAGYNGQETTGLTLIEDTVYDYQIDYKTYNLTVDGIQNNDGSTRSETYTAKYGETFDFSDLTNTGTAKDGTYTKFSGIATTATITVNGKEEVIDLTQKINGKIAEALLAGVSATAEYVDNSVTVTFAFTGLNHTDVTQKLQKGTTPSLSEIEEIVSDNGLAIKEISPDISKVNAPTIYQVICGELVGPTATITLHENGGSDVLDITKVEGSLIGPLPVPVKAGYSFGGWYRDNGTFFDEFTTRKMPVGGAVLYAKWTANEYIVTFNVNGGNELAATEQTKAVTFDSTYGILPTPTKSGYGFIGWFTAANGGTEVTAAAKVSVTASQMLYAHWKQLKEIPVSVFDFGDVEIYTYTTGTHRQPAYTFTAEAGETYSDSDFTFHYKIQGETDYVEGLPIQGGTYDVLVTRNADNDYSKFEYLYTGVLTINYISFDVNANWYMVEIKERSGTGSSYNLSTKLYWGNGDVNSASMPIDKDWNTKYYKNYGTRPTRVTAEKSGNVSRTMHFEVYCYDILGNKTTMYTNEKYIVNGYWRDVNLSDKLPDVDTSANGINVDDCSKIVINLNTYGVKSEALTGVEYIVDNPAVTVKGNKLLIDGSLLISDTNTITVSAQYPGGSVEQIAQFNVTKNIVD